MKNNITAKLLLSKVKTASLDKELLRESAEISATLSKYGLKEWCIYGQPGPDGTCGKFHVQPAQLGAFVNEISNFKNSLINFDVFPLGIIDPELYEVNMKFGSRRSI